MLLHEQISRSLADLKGLSSLNPKTVGWSVDQGPAVEIDFTGIDSLSCAFRELRVSADALKAAPLDLLKGWADRLCERVTYLLEQIGPLELDGAAQAILVRSIPPAKDASRTSFYEMLVKAPGVVSLRRYVCETASPDRQPVDINVTREVLLKLVRDIVEAIPTVTAA
jgi:hypothetical protein